MQSSRRVTSTWDSDSRDTNTVTQPICLAGDSPEDGAAEIPQDQLSTETLEGSGCCIQFCLQTSLLQALSLSWASFVCVF